MKWAFLLLVAASCGVRTERIVPTVSPPSTPLGAHVVRAVETSSRYSAAGLRVVSPSDLETVLREGLSRAGMSGPGGRYVLHVEIAKLEGGAMGFSSYAIVAADARLVDDRDPGWAWVDHPAATPGTFPVPGVEGYTGVDGQRRAFEDAVHQVATRIVEHVRDTRVRRAASTGP